MFHLERIALFATCALLVPGCPDDPEESPGETESGSSSGSTTDDPTTGTNPTSSTTDNTSSTTDDTSSTSDGTSSTTDDSTSTTDDSTSSGSDTGTETEGACPNGEMCDDVCVDTETDVAHCGDCNMPCSEENASPACESGTCVLTCDDNYGDCDTDVSTGCEQPLDTPAHCGACDTPGAEVCDGASNDCDDMTAIDAGCPTGITPADGTFDDHDQYGNLTGGSAFSDVCPDGSALVGFSGNSGGNIDRIRGVCAEMLFVSDTDVTPYAYTIESGTTTTLDTHGSNETTAYDIGCPANNFVVGISGEASDGGLHDLTIHCAELMVTGAPGSFAVTYGAVTTATVDGDNSGDAYSDLLTAPAVADRYRGRGGAWIDAIGLGQATLNLDVIAP